MSDGVATNAAPMDAGPTEAPAETNSTPVEATKPPPKPRTIDDDLEDVLKKHGGLKYKAAGKEKSITAAKDLTRYLSRVDGTDAAASEALKKSQAAEARDAKIAALAKMRPAELTRALEELGVPRASIRRAIEDEILGEDSRSKEQAQLTPRERQLQAELEQHQSELSQLREAQETTQREQQQAEHVQRVTEIGQRMEKAAVGALTKAKISPEHVTRFLPALADRLDRNERLGLGLDDDELSEVVLKEHETLADQYYGGLEVGALADKLEGVGLEDPENPGKQTTRLKLLMRECAKRLRAKNGQGLPVASTVRAPAQKGGDSDAEKMAFWRR